MAKLRVNLTPAIGKLQIVSERLVSTNVVGTYKSVFKGRGLEFASYRQYNEADDANLIDWKASMRTNSLLIKEFEEERNVNVFLLIDASSSMVFGSTTKLKNEYTAELAAAIAYTVLQAGDSLGYAMFSDKITEKLPPSTGSAQFYRLSKTITESKNYGGGYDFVEALKFVLNYLKGSAIIIVLSDFIGLKGDWQKYLRMVSHKFDLIGIMVRDPTDRFLPDVSGNIIFGDPFSNDQIVVNVQKVREEYRNYVRRQEMALREVFIRAKADFLPLSTDEHFVKPITDFFKRREQRMR